MQVIAFDKKWTKQKSGYYQSTTQIDGKRRWLHQYSWEQHNETSQPKGFCVHHKDHNKDNNEIINLQLMTHGDHRSHHGFEGDVDKMKKHLGNIRPLTKAYHSSPEGIKQHKEHYDNMKHKLYVKGTFTCLQCGIEYEGVINGSNKFCSNNCASKHRRDSGVDDEERHCERCNKSFIVNKYQKNRFCTKSCARTKGK